MVQAALTRLNLYRPPDLEEFKRWQDAAEGLVRLVTVSPEWPETPDYVAALTGMGVVVSVGHTKATGEQIRAAVDAGATMSTHLGNGAHTTLHKTDNYIWDQLAEERLSPSFILDDIHIPAAFFKTARSRKRRGSFRACNRCSHACHVQARLLSARLSGC